ncbi:hypothetical protein NADFUDRAFT_69849 [Nadsonia fulvescens var. elongata DSM 6958]|uniref:Rap-GAP domain-containing protein n=1 Tax=Nadsonia fulvescens var. elongata DSM 6958 TaxID=857566 RepID=A0A1E3PMR5_9ASCO|nr:hypothetical protein NADFUDRAFT_69849 [Nadsonia fulvescens var. elongata DSM 6958]
MSDHSYTAKTLAKRPQSTTAPSSSSSGFGGVFKSITRTLKGSSTASPSTTTSVPIARLEITPTIIGGVSNQEDLISQLLSTSMTERINATKALTESVNNYSVSSVAEIWYASQHLVHISQPVECRRAAWILLSACIKQEEGAMGSRLLFFKAILEHTNLEDFDLQLEALKTLTNNGKDFFDLFQSGYPVALIFCNWLKLLAYETYEINRKRKKDMALPYGTTTEKNCQNFIRLLIEILKKNHHVFKGIELENLVKELVGLCRRTSSPEDMSLGLEAFDSLMAYSYIPINNLQDVISIICGVSVILPDLEAASLKAIKNMINSHLSTNTINTLLNILEARGDIKKINSNTIRGSLRFLLNILKDTSPTKPLDLTIGAVLKALYYSLDIDSAKYHLEVCQTMYELISDENLRGKITYEDWESEYSPLKIIIKCSQGTLFRTKSRGSQAARTFDSMSMFSQTTAEISGQVHETFVNTLSLLTTLVGEKLFKCPKEFLISFLLEMIPYFDESTAFFVIKYFDDSHLCTPFSENWSTNIDILLNVFFHDPTWGTQVRLRVLEVIKSVFNISKELSTVTVIDKIINDVCSNILNEADIEVFKAILECFILLAPETNYKDIDYHVEHPIQLTCRTFARIFALTMKHNAKKAQLVFDILIDALSTFRRSGQTLPFLESARLFCRIRVDTENFVYLTNPTDMDGLAASVGRNYSNNPEKARNNKLFSWWYPEPIFFLEDLELDVRSQHLKVATLTENATNKKDSEDCFLDISRWLSEVIDALRTSDDTNDQGQWEIYSFVLAHLGPQLTNLRLFGASKRQIVALHDIICESIHKLPQRISNYNSNQNSDRESIKPSELQVAFIRTTSSLVGYDDFFSRHEEDQIVQSLVMCLSSWQTTAIPCVHGLIVCSHEFPLSIKRYLGQIFHSFQTKITSVGASSHIMEFLLDLGRQPSLTTHFTPENYRQVFGMAIRYIQHASDLEKREKKEGRRQRQMNYDEAGAETTPSTMRQQTSDDNAVMPQYQLALAYDVISVWFLSVSLPNRRHLALYIIRGLILADGNPDEMDERSMACLDLLQRFTYSDLDLQMNPLTRLVKPWDSKTGVTKTKRWIYGHGIISIETEISSGKSQIIVRRSSGVSIFNINPGTENSDALKPMKLKKQEGKPEAFTPSFVLMQLFTPLHSTESLKPILLEDDPATLRAITAIDRIPIVDFHKVGVMYMAPYQTNEQEIFANQTGSVVYRRFLAGLGDLIRLKDNKRIYTGGLDTENNIDGEFAYAWNDKTTQLIFHTTTMMPPPSDPSDTSYSTKKRHIGNNYINLYFNESGLPFDFNVVKSQFNFINIVVTPHTLSMTKSHSLVDEGLEIKHAKRNKSEDEELSTRRYKVRAYRKAGVPAIFATCHMKIVSEEKLPDFIRNLVLIASKFATVWHTDGKYISSWTYRHQQINTLKQKALTHYRQQAQEDEQKYREQKEREIRGGPSDEKDTVWGRYEDSMNQLPLQKVLEFSSYTE